MTVNAIIQIIFPCGFILLRITYKRMLEILGPAALATMSAAIMSSRTQTRPSNIRVP